MPERRQTLMRTRCPDCGTIFRVTSEQLRQKAGQVRCGHCQVVFNAFDNLLAEPEAASPATVSAPPSAPAAPAPTAIPTLAPTPAADEAAAPVAEISAPAVDETERPVFTADATLVVDREPFFVQPPAQAAPPEVAETAVGDSPAAVTNADLAEEGSEKVAGELAGEVAEETAEESTQAAREAGLVAARELSELPSYNRWAAGTLAGNSFGLEAEAARRPLWPFVMAALLLALALLGQLAYHFRGEMVLRLPASATAYAALGVEVPLPRNAELIAIEASDLQADNARGLFVLQATLRNRAAYAQAWPVLELTLTDINDAVVARRAMYAAEYLPPGTPAESFAANGELAVRLWVEAKGIGATGYRLYIFYP